MGGQNSGNPLYPSNQGKTCPKGQVGLQILYDSDRIKGPVGRVGERGSGRWERISWRRRLKALRES